MRKIVFLIAMVAAFSGAMAQTSYTWTGTSGNWTDSTKWSPNGVPGSAAGDSATINSAVTVTLSAALSNSLSSLTVSSGTLSLAGSVYTLSVSGTITVGGTIVVDDDNGAASLITISCGTLTINSTGIIHANGKGGAGAAVSGGSGAGTGGGQGSGTTNVAANGAGYGGRGGAGSNNGAGGNVYGSISSPAEIGSGGGAYFATDGGAGGGRIRLVVGGQLSVDGSIQANGVGVASGSGCGSGGSIWITAGTVTGTGTIAVNGGSTTSSGGAGAGGRIAIDGYSGTISATLQARGGTSSTGQEGGAGTIFKKSVTATNGELVVDNGGNSGAVTDFVDGSYSFDKMDVLSGAIVNQTLSDTFTVGDLTINGTWTHTSGSTKGVEITATNLTVGASGLIHGNSRGGAGATSSGGNGVGTGGGNGSGTTNVSASGASYGGNGGKGSSNGNYPIAYGSINNPTDLGSGGGAYFATDGGAGGGRVRLVISGQLSVDGNIQVNGAGVASGSGCGSGGSVWITAGTVTGAGTVASNGGATTSSGGGGAGGRIAIDGFNGSIPITLQTKGGTSTSGQDGAAGSIYLLPQGAANPDLRFDNAITTSGSALTPVPATAAAANTLTIGNGVSLQITSALSVSGGTTSVNNGTSVTFNGSLYTFSHFGTVSVGSTGTIVVNDDNAAGSLITLSISTFSIATGGLVHANSCGAAGGTTSGASGTGSGYGSGSATTNVAGNGAGYGGRGGAGSSNGGAGAVYGSISNPVDIGSGGGAYFGTDGGAGGGRIRLVVSGELSVVGNIQANGVGVASGSGCGSGGSVWITAGTVTGTGTIAANGGATTSSGGGGAGGRIAIDGYSGTMAPALQTRGGSSTSGQGGGAGTIFTKSSTATYGDVVVDNGGLSGAITEIIDGSYTFDNATISGGAILTQSSGDIFTIGNLTVSATWTHVTGSTKGVEITATNIAVANGGTIHGNGRGYAGGIGSGASGVGPGAGAGSGTTNVSAKGAGHGGRGGAGVNNSAGGVVYGSLSSPTDLGSGGGAYFSTDGGYGGGRIRLVVSGELSVVGNIQANGVGVGSGSGCGSGGSVWVTAGTVTGTGIISANGGSTGSSGGGGAGGRIAIDSYSGGIVPTLQARGGSAASGGQGGGAGTIFTKSALASNGDLLVDNGAMSGAVTDMVDDSYVFDNMTVSGAAILTQSLNDSFNIGTLTVSATWTHDSASTKGVEITAGAMTIPGGGLIHGNGRGYAGANTSGGSGVGPGAGAGSGTTNVAAKGAGHGGRGGAGVNNSAGGPVYDSISSPTELGSGGGAYFATDGGAGGGRVRLAISGQLSVDGSIQVNGVGVSASSGCGSGGSIWVSAGIVAGSGSVTANGGATGSNGGGGGGGRIAFDGFSGTIPLSLQARGGSAASGGQGGGAGTIFIKASADSLADVTIDNGGLAGAVTDLVDGSYVFDDMVVQAGAILQQSPADSVTVNNLTLNSEWTHTFGSAAGIRIAAANITIGASGIFNANAMGYSGATSSGGSGFGPGAGPGSGTTNVAASGGGHGGAGGKGVNKGTSGAAYGSQSAPIDPGSGGGAYFATDGGDGGGLVRLVVSGTLTNDGIIRANGQGSSSSSGSGAGGSIYVVAGTFAGSGSVIADGGSTTSSGGDGGGGRIAIFANSSSFAGTISAAGQTGDSGATNSGSGVLTIPAADSLITLDTPPDGNVGTGTVTWSGFTLPVGGTFKAYLDDDEHLGEGEPTSNHVEIGAAVQTQTTSGNSATFGGLTSGTTYYWHVVALDASSNIVAGSDIFKFVVTQVPNNASVPFQKKTTAGTTLSTGGYTDENKIDLGATGGDPDVPDLFKLQFEVRPISQAFTSPGVVTVDNVNFFETAFSATNGPETLTKTITGLTNGEKYHWQVRAVDSNGVASSWVPYPQPVNSDTPPAAIDFAVDNTAPVAGSVTDGAGADIDFQTSASQITAKWSGFGDAESGISFFEWAIGTSPGASNVQTFTSIGSSTNATNSALTLSNGTTYYITVRATNASGLTSTATSNGVKVDSTAPTAGTVNDGIGADVDTQTFATALYANWTGLTDSETTLTTEWAIGTTPGGAQALAFTTTGISGSTASFTATLADGATYYVTVRATNQAGLVTTVTSDGVTVDSSAPIAGVVNDGTAGDVDAQISANTISANWSGFSDPHTGIAQFEWAIGTTPGASNTQAFASVGLSTSATNSALPLVNNTTYYVTVRATNGVGLQSTVISDGVLVTTDSTPPVPGTINDGTGADIDLQASPSTISANWSGFSDPETGVSGYEWAIGITVEGTDIQGFVGVGTSTSATATGLSLSGGQFYFVTVRATNGASFQSVASSDGVMVDTSDPTAGTVNDGIAADIDVQGSATTISANWSGFTDTESGVTGYEWAIGTGLGAANLQGFTSVGTNTSGTNNTLTLTNGTKYYVAVRATNGVSLKTIAVSDGVIVDTSAPTGGIVNDGTAADITWQKSTTTIDANWSGFADFESGIASYEYAVGTTSGGTQALNFTNVGTALSASNSTLTLANGMKYYVTVRAANGVALTSTKASNGVTVDTVAPTAPQNLAASSGPTLTWDSSTDSGSGLDHHELYSGATLIDGTIPKYATMKTVSGLSVGTYTFYLVAVDVAGNSSSQSNSVTVTISAPKILFASPRGFSTTGGTVKIFGETFDPKSGGVKIAPYPAGTPSFGLTFTPVDSAQIAAFMPSSAVFGSANISVTNKSNVSSSANACVAYCGALSAPIEGSVNGGDTTAAYRMISVPVFMSPQQFAEGLEKSLGKYNEVLWRLFRWNPLKGRYEEWTNINSDMLLDCAGYSFWLISRRDAKITVTDGLSTSDAAYVYVPLQPGWNQVANPYSGSVTWGSVLVGTSLSSAVTVSSLSMASLTPILKVGAVWSNGGYFLVNDTDPVLPKRGFWVYNGGTSVVVLYFPKPLSAKPEEDDYVYSTPYNQPLDPPQPPGTESSQSSSGGNSSGGGCFVGSSNSGSVGIILCFALLLLMFFTITRAKSDRLS